MAFQKYKGDATELKFDSAGGTLLTTLSADKDDFFDGAYACFILGEMLWDNELSPLASAIKRTIFRESFATLFESFQAAGTFESYISVFENIFGADVEVTFTVPAAGKLNIDIVAATLEESNFIARRIVDNEWINDEIVDYVGDNIVFQSVKGFESQYELERMLYEMVPAGIFTTITLTVGA
jgi:hypothetical protein